MGCYEMRVSKKYDLGWIIITTRHNIIDDVARIETNYVHNLNQLSEQESQVLFYIQAFLRNYARVLI